MHELDRLPSHPKAEQEAALEQPAATPEALLPREEAALLSLIAEQQSGGGEPHDTLAAIAEFQADPQPPSAGTPERPPDRAGEAPPTQMELLKQEELAAKNELERQYDSGRWDYHIPYAVIGLQQVQDKITQSRLEERLSQSETGKSDELIAAFLQEQLRDNEAGRIQAKIDDARQKQRKLAETSERLGRNLRRLEAEVNQAEQLLKTAGPAEQEGRRAQLRYVKSDYYALYDKKQEQEEAAALELHGLEQNLEINGQELAKIQAQALDDFAVPARMEDDPDYAHSLKSASFAPDEDTAGYRQKTGYDPAAEASLIFQRRFPEKYAFYQKRFKEQPPAEAPPAAREPSSEIEQPIPDAQGPAPAPPESAPELPEPESPPHAQLIEAFSSAGLPLSPEITNRLNELPEHQEARMGSGFTDATRRLSNLASRPRSNKDLALLAEKVRSGMEERLFELDDAEEGKVHTFRELLAPEAIQELRESVAAIKDEESQIIARMALDVLVGQASEYGESDPVLPPAEIHMGSCTSAEIYFLDYLRPPENQFFNYTQPGSHMNVIQDESGKPIMLEKVGLGEKGSCITLEETVLNGVRVPPGSLVGVAYSQERRQVLPGKPETNLALKDCTGFRLLRLTTLAVSPENRGRAFRSHYTLQQSHGEFYGFDTATLDQLRTKARDTLEPAS